MAGLDALQRDRGDIGPHGVAVKAGRDGQLEQLAWALV
jgi:hypothetical protein